MSDQLDQIKQKLTEISSRLSLGQKISIGVVLILTIGVIAAISISSSGTKMGYVFTNLSTEDAASITEALTKEKIPYQIDAGGTAIKVPAEKVMDVRLKLAGEGLPKGGGVGYEIFDSRDVTTLTDFTEHVNMVRAIQGELQRTISSLAPVKSARVHIVIPKESMFVQDQKEPTASVVLNLHQGRSLSQKHVDSIIHLVASSVEGMKADKVTVVDNSGAILSGGESDTEGLSGKKLVYKKSVEKDLENNILKLIGPIVGDGKARVSVNTEIDFDQAERAEEVYNPNITAVRSETKMEESKENGTNQPGGVAGAEANLPGRAGQAVTAENASKSTLEKSTTNYEINKTVRKVKENVGSLKKVTVSVVLDGIEKKIGKKTEIVPISDTQLKSIEELVKNAIGFDVARGDRIVVNSIPFAIPKEIDDKVPVYQEILDYALKFNFVPWLLVFAFLFFVGIKLLKSIRAVAPVPLAAEGGGAISGSDFVGAEEERIAIPKKTKEEEELEALSNELEESMGLQIPKEQLVVINYARKNVDVTSKILKKWMRERK